MSKLLFSIEGYRRTALGLAPLPGVSAELMTDPQVRAIRQGTVLQLLTPSGTRRLAKIENYCIQVSVTREEIAVNEVPPILIIFSDELNEREMPLGTEVWLDDADMAEKC